MNTAEVPVAPRDVVLAYFTAHRAHDLDALRQVFASDAQLVVGDRLMADGLDEISQVFETVFGRDVDGPHPGELLVLGNRVAVELTVRIDGITHAIADFLEVSDGKIRRLVAYTDTANLPVDAGKRLA